MTLTQAEFDSLRTAQDVPFRIRKIGHVVLRASNLRKSVEFYVRVLGFAISDIYPEEMVPGGMVFMRCTPDHHGVALVGGPVCRSQWSSSIPMDITLKSTGGSTASERMAAFVPRTSGARHTRWRTRSKIHLRARACAWPTLR
jgi:hypothetical protein